MSVPDLQEIAAALSRLEAQQRRLKTLMVALAPVTAVAVVIFLYVGLMLFVWIIRWTGID